MIRTFEAEGYIFKDVEGLLGIDKRKAQVMLLIMVSGYPDMMKCTPGSGIVCGRTINLGIYKGGELVGAWYLGNIRQEGSNIKTRAMPGFPGMAVADEVVQIGNVGKWLLSNPLPDEAGPLQVVTHEYALMDTASARLTALQAHLDTHASYKVTKTPDSPNARVHIILEKA